VVRPPAKEADPASLICIIVVMCYALDPFNVQRPGPHGPCPNTHMTTPS